MLNKEQIRILTGNKSVFGHLMDEIREHMFETIGVDLEELADADPSDPSYQDLEDDVLVFLCDSLKTGKY